MSRTFFYKTNDRQTFGPFSTQELKGEAAQGRLNPDDTVWIDGANEIYKAKLIKGLFDSADYPQPTPVERPANNISPAIDTTVEAPVINVDPTPEVAPSSTPPPLPTQTKEWFYSKEGQQLGDNGYPQIFPITVVQLFQLAGQFLQRDKLQDVRLIPLLLLKSA
jgi:hypothetical protein